MSEMNMENKSRKRGPASKLYFIFIRPCCCSITSCNYLASLQYPSQALTRAPLQILPPNPSSSEADWGYYTKCGLLTSVARLSKTT